MAGAKARLKFALLGCGNMMGVHARILKDHPDAEIVALCDATVEKAKEFADKHLSGAPRRPALFADAAAMYAQTRPDAVVISTPHTQHYAQGVQALEAGCHVFMEKPMVTTLEHAYGLAEKVQKAGKVLVIGYNTPCSAEFAYLRELIRTKAMGPLEVVTGFISQDWLRYPLLWRRDPALSGGGQACDSGAHLFSSLCWSVESEVDQVFAFVDNHGAEVDINSVASIRFANGVMANITIGGNCMNDGSFMAFLFDGGRVEIDGWLARWIRVFKGMEQVKYPPITPDMGAVSPIHNFIDAVLSRAEPRTNPHHGVIQSQLMDAFYESQRTGQPARPRRRG